MTDLAELNLLIDRARAIVGTDANVAKTLGVPFQTVSNWRHGHKNASPEDCALLAAVAGMDPMQEAARAMLRKHEGTKKGDLLMKALGKASLVTGAAVASAGAHAGTAVNWISGWMASHLGDLWALHTMYIAPNKQKTAVLV